MSLRRMAYACASALVACVPTRHECKWGEVEDVPGACYTKDGEVWFEGEIVVLDAATDAEVHDGDAGEPDTGEGPDASLQDAGVTGEAGLDGGVGQDDGQVDGGDAAVDAGCMNDLECSQLSATPYCHLESHSCVECIPGALERTQCTNERACNPGELTCSGAPRGSVNWCKSCITDTECAEQDDSVHRCVPMSFQGRALGTFCLRVAPTTACPNPTSVVKRATSVLGVEDDYCFPDEERATCDALLDFGTPCTSNEMCGITDLNDGMCVSVSAGAKRCTYACDSASDCSTACIGTPGAQHCNPN